MSPSKLPTARSIVLSVCLVALVMTLASAQFRGGGRWRRRPNREDYPQWQLSTGFKNDVFTFVRVRYDSFGYSRPGRYWDNDYPDCDWNFSYRLQQLTSLQVDPKGKVLRLTDPELFDHPFIFMSNVGRMDLSPAEVKSLRRYLLQGGFLLADDFWAPHEWRHVAEQMRQVFPHRRPRELTKEHEIFHNVFDLRKRRLQVMSIHAWRQGDSFEYWHGDPMGDEDPHFWAYSDDRGRVMALFCHNNDVGDGWEREGENRDFFKQFSERVSFPLGINIVTYALTH